MVIATDPFDKSSGLTPPRFGADAVLISHGHENHSNAESLSGKNENEVFKITGPGEYEFGGITVRGIHSFHDSKEGKVKGKNTIYVIEWEDMRIVHMGDFGENELRPEVQEAIGTPDILFIPVGGEAGGTIDAERAAKILNQIEPRIIIPMHYKISGLKDKLDGVEEFMEEMGLSHRAKADEKDVQPEEKLTLKKKDLPAAEHSKIVILKTP